MPEATLIIRYLVTLHTKRGVVEMEVPTVIGPNAAARRARWALISQRKYGDVDDVIVITTEALCMWDSGCERLASTTREHPDLGDTPICATHNDVLNTP